MGLARHAEALARGQKGTEERRRRSRTRDGTRKRPFWEEESTRQDPAREGGGGCEEKRGGAGQGKTGVSSLLCGGGAFGVCVCAGGWWLVGGCVRGKLLPSLAHHAPSGRLLGGARIGPPSTIIIPAKGKVWALGPETRAVVATSSNSRCFSFLCMEPLAQSGSRVERFWKKELTATPLNTSAVYYSTIFDPAQSVCSAQPLANMISRALRFAERAVRFRLLFFFFFLAVLYQSRSCHDPMLFYVKPAHRPT